MRINLHIIFTKGTLVKAKFQLKTSTRVFYPQCRDVDQNASNLSRDRLDELSETIGFIRLLGHSMTRENQTLREINI